VDNGNGTITDHATGLMWMKSDSGSGKIWSDALSYAENLDYAGYADWRLPNAKELQGILDYSRSPDTTSSPAMDPIFSSTSITDEGGSTNWPFYWTGTTHVTWNDLGKNAAYVSFGEALGWMEELPPGSQNYNLMDVHGAGSQRSDPKEGNPADYPHGHGPQGDVIHIYNYVRCVRDIVSNNTGPEHTKDIESVSFPEDGSGEHLVNVSEHFSEDTDLIFRIVIEQSGSTNINCEVDANGHFLNFDAPADWFGKEEFRVKAYDTGADGIYENADDEFAHSNWFNVTVTPTDDPPEIVSVNGTAPSSSTAELLAYPGQELNIVIVATDQDGDVIKYSSNSSVFLIHESSGRLTGTPTSEELSIHWVNITAKEVNSSVSPAELLFDSINLKITVRTTNERPYITKFTPIGSDPIEFLPGYTVLECREDETTVWAVSYEDPDGDACIFSSNFTNQRFELDGSTGNISFSPIQGDVGNHHVNITITDQWLMNWANIVIRVENVNDPPVVEPITHAGFVDSLTVTFSTSEAFDEDGDELNYTWDFGDGGGGNGLSEVHTYADQGNFTVILSVSDGYITTKISKNISAMFTSTEDDDDDDTMDDDKENEEDAKGTESNLWVWVLIIIIVILIVTGVIGYVHISRTRGRDPGDGGWQEPNDETDENGQVKWE